MTSTELIVFVLSFCFFVLCIYGTYAIVDFIRLSASHRRVRKMEKEYTKTNS